MSRDAISLRGLHFTYPDGREALQGVDLRIGKGERVALLGPNGAGKTTLALHLNGIYRGDRGTVMVDDLLVGEPHLTEIRRRVGLVFQDPDNQLFMPTVSEDVAFGPANLGLSGAELEHRVHEALSEVGAVDLADRAPHHLSSGERRRAAIATAVAMHPQVLVLDEPSSGLDPAGRGELVETLRGLEITLLVITHDLFLAYQLCPRAVIMDGGRIVADGSTEAILSDGDLLRRHRLELPFAFDPSRRDQPDNQKRQHPQDHQGLGRPPLG